jgi:hypothetical protein
MPGLVPGSHALLFETIEKTWMAGTKPGHDGAQYPTMAHSSFPIPFYMIYII